MGFKKNTCTRFYDARCVAEFKLIAPWFHSMSEVLNKTKFTKQIVEFVKGLNVLIKIHDI